MVALVCRGNRADAGGKGFRGCIRLWPKMPAGNGAGRLHRSTIPPPQHPSRKHPTRACQWQPALGCPTRLEHLPATARSTQQATHTHACKMSVPMVICPGCVLAVRASPSTLTTMVVLLMATRAPTNAPCRQTKEGRAPRRQVGCVAHTAAPPHKRQPCQRDEEMASRQQAGALAGWIEADSMSACR